MMAALEQERALGRLRFPTELEPVFQQDYYQKILLSLRIGMALMALTLVGQGIGWYFQTSADSAQLPQVIGRPIALLAMLGLTCWRDFWRYWQLCFVALFAIGFPTGVTVVGQSLANNTFWRGAAAHLGYLSLLTLYSMVMLSQMLRLHFRWTALYQVMLAGWSLWAALVYIQMPAEHILMFYGFIILPVLVMVIFAAYAYERLQRSAFLSNHLLEIERAKSEAILRNTLPDAIVDRLKASDGLIADDHVEVTVLFGDIVDFTPWSADKPAREVLDFLNQIFSRFDRLVGEYDLEKIKTVGDCYMVAAGAPTPRADHVEVAARLALAMQAEAARLSAEQGTPMLFRIGLHTGPLIAGVIGEKRFLYDVWGDTVNMASRLESHGIPGAIQVSAEVAERLRGRFALEPRGEVEIKGKGLVETYLLKGEIGLEGGTKTLP